jgi:hypothetical protein
MDGEHPVNNLRRRFLISGLGGLVACAVVAAIAAWLVQGGVIKALLPFPAIILLLVVILGGLSVAEIPIMVFAMRRLLVERPGNHGFVLGLNTLYVFFAAVYGTPVILLTGSLVWGLALCGLSIVRLAASLVFVIGPQIRQQPQPKDSETGDGSKTGEHP